MEPQSDRMSRFDACSLQFTHPCRLKRHQETKKHKFRAKLLENSKPECAASLKCISLETEDMAVDSVYDEYHQEDSMQTGGM